MSCHEIPSRAIIYLTFEVIWLKNGEMLGLYKAVVTIINTVLICKINQVIYIMYKNLYLFIHSNLNDLIIKSKGERERERKVQLLLCVWELKSWIFKLFYLIGIINKAFLLIHRFYLSAVVEK
jgi:hypothetical protein